MTKSLLLLLVGALSSCGFVKEDCGSKEVVISLFTRKGIQVEDYSLEKKDGFCVHHVSFKNVIVPVIYYKGRYVMGAFFDEKGRALYSLSRTPLRPPAAQQPQQLPQQQQKNE